MVQVPYPLYHLAQDHPKAPGIDAYQSPLLS